jgi:argininosuccinate lyase
MSDSSELGQAVLDRLGDLHRENQRLEALLQQARDEAKETQVAYSALAEMLGERIEVHSHLEMPSYQHRVKAEVVLDGAFLRSSQKNRHSVVERVGRTLHEVILLNLLASTAEYSRDREIARGRLRHLRPPEPLRVG